MTNNKIYAIVFGDTHGGSIGGAMAPGTRLKTSEPGEQEKFYTLELSPAQEKIWALTEKAITRTLRIIGDAPLIGLFGGDMTAGIKHVEQMVQGGGRLANQYAISYQYIAAIKKRLPNLCEFWAANGTDAHSVMDGTSEEVVCSYINDGLKIPAEAVDHLRLTINGCTVDMAHHGPSTGQAWTQDGPVRTYLRRAMMLDLDALALTKPADLYLRHHVHSYGWAAEQVERGGRWYRSQMYVVPSLCKINGYARQAARSPGYSRHGFLLVEFLPGEIGGTWQIMQTFDSRQYRQSVVAYSKGTFGKGDGQLG